jgi:hypothetical protein
MSESCFALRRTRGAAGTFQATWKPYGEW